MLTERETLMAKAFAQAFSDQNIARQERGNNGQGQLPRRALVLGGASAACLPMLTNGARAVAEETADRQKPQTGAQGPAGSGRFVLALNTGSIMGYRLDVIAQVELAAEAGYQGIEFWMRDIERFVQGGGRLEELRKRLDDSGLVVVGAINFNPWAVDDETQRRAGLEAFRRDMDWIARLGGTAIAAAPAGINQAPPVDLRRVAERYRTLLELGDEYGVVPELEIWGGSTNLRRVSEALFVAAEADHPRARLLLDVFHMYKGGSSFESLRVVNGACMTNFHINDYPAEPPREKIGDQHRVFPGDGVAPMAKILQLLWQSGYRGALALELFNRQYWERPAREMVREGLAKMKAAVEQAFADTQVAT